MSWRSGASHGELSLAIRANLSNWPPLHLLVAFSVLGGLDKEIPKFMCNSAGVLEKQQERVGRGVALRGLQVGFTGFFPGNKKSCYTPRYVLEPLFH